MSFGTQALWFSWGWKASRDYFGYHLRNLYLCSPFTKRYHCLLVDLIWHYFLYIALSLCCYLRYCLVLYHLFTWVTVLYHCFFGYSHLERSHLTCLCYFLTQSTLFIFQSVFSSLINLPLRSDTLELRLLESELALVTVFLLVLSSFYLLTSISWTIFNPKHQTKPILWYICLLRVSYTHQ